MATVHSSYPSYHTGNIRELYYRADCNRRGFSTGFGAYCKLRDSVLV